MGVRFALSETYVALDASDETLWLIPMRDPYQENKTQVNHFRLLSQQSIVFLLHQRLRTRTIRSQAADATHLASARGSRFSIEVNWQPACAKTSVMLSLAVTTLSPTG
ncbi:hypothetical protein [Granulosicoccus antarcticus]|uniref:Uncharacterized protein n=1 Tax=Granulosicoccus antarcticus IMCC3135 TaxID=1192854 RepID=A0A2Z2NVC4_9GAMM|nr:hypothetical protein [Granulosicoccus antarcticus]ASJ71607.1 hypothetical protein IMCC3135_07510 [Granulosicoccus antarcticus IMCC3135]